MRLMERRAGNAVRGGSEAMQISRWALAHGYRSAYLGHATPANADAADGEACREVLCRMRLSQHDFDIGRAIGWSELSLATAFVDEPVE